MDQVRLLKEAHQLRGGEFLNFLRERRMKWLEDMSEAPDAATYRIMQGRARELKELIRFIDNSRAELEKLEAGRPSMAKAF